MNLAVKIPPGDAADTDYVGLDGSEMAELVEELAGKGVSARFVARGGSMSPWIRDGDMVTVAPPGPVTGHASGTAGRKARLGDVAAFRRPGSGRLTVHRLIRRVTEGWVAQGDRLGGTDGIIADSEILGIVTRVERRGRMAFLPRGVAAVLLARFSRAALDLRLRYAHRNVVG